MALQPSEIPKPLVVEIDARSPDPTAIEAAARTILAGGLVAFPTETVYGLGADALSADAVRRIFEAKGRPSINPVIVHIADESMLASVTTTWPEKAQLLAQAFWPGPLTLVLPRHPKVPDIVTAGGSTVAIRWPNHPIAQELILAAGKPIAAPSANRSSEISPTKAEHVVASLGNRIDMVLDGGQCPGGIESTVLDLSSDLPRLLRPGLITLDQLEKIIGKVEYSISSTQNDPILASPGLLPRHYSPRTPLKLFGDRKELIKQVMEDNRRVQRKAVIIMGTHEDLCHNELTFYNMPNSPEEFATHLYATLHTVDQANYDLILMELPPDQPEWLAIRDRLKRAAALK